MARGVVGLVAVVALLATQSSAAATPSPCALLTNAEVAKAIGSEVVSRTPTSNKYFRGCKWLGKNLARSGFMPTQRTVMLQLFPSTRAQFLKTAEDNPGVRRVIGVGELAFVIPQGGGGFFNAYARGYAIELEVSLVTNGIPIEKTLAKAAVARL